MCTGDTMGPESIARKSSETRRSNKPIMEKRRRARINNCLNELKNLILDALKKDPARHSKLEKADILEMTVKHLENLQRQTMAMAIAADPSVVNKYRAGFNECVNEVTRFLGKVDNMNPQVKQRLLGHLANCLNGSSVSSSSSEVVPGATVQVQLPLPTISVVSQGSQHPAGALQLVPTQLSNGDFAYVVPAPPVPPEQVPSKPEAKVPPTAVVAPVLHVSASSKSGAGASAVGLDLRTDATKEAAAAASSSGHEGPMKVKAIAGAQQVEEEVKEEDAQDIMWRPW